MRSRLVVTFVLFVPGCAHWTPATTALAPGTTVTVHTKSNEEIVGEVSGRTGDALVVEGRSIRESEIESVEAKIDPANEQRVVASNTASNRQASNGRGVKAAAITGGVIAALVVTGALVGLAALAVVALFLFV